MIHDVGVVLASQGLKNLKACLVETDAIGGVSNC